MRVLVTGGAGYIGSILCEHLLDAGHHVTVLDNLMYGSGSLFHLAHREEFEFVKGDVRDRGVLNPLVQTAEIIIPLAAIVGAPACDQDPSAANSTNYKAILEILFATTATRQLIIYPTTNSGYGTQSDNILCTEDTPLRSISIYGLTKEEAEWKILDRPNTISLRLATVFGCSPRMRLDLLVNDFTYKAFTDGYIALYEPHFKRNYVHIRDVADCFIHCIDNADKMVGRVYNVGLDSANLSKLQLAEQISHHLDVEVFQSDYGTDLDKRNYVVSNQRLREAGFEAKRGLDEGIEELIKGFKMMGRGRYSNV